MVVNELYYGSVWHDTIAPIKAEASGISISDDVIAAALRNIYRRDFNPHTDIEPNLFNAIAHTLGQAVSEGTVQGGFPALGNDPFIDALRHSTDVFSAFKVHRTQNDMAARLLDSNGNLKPFEQWKQEVLPIADHQCHNWLETEYNTAVLRARQAANWQQFQAEKDILPNLKWLPSTSPNPGEDHRPFWNTILPVDHPFWNEHRPGDRWNCKCDLTSTDEPATPVPSVAVSQQPRNTPQPGLKDNPGKSQAVFSDDHPYFPSDCKHCAFYNPTLKARLATVITARVKDCFNCPYIEGCINRIATKQPIDDAANARKQDVRENDLMPAMPDREFVNLITGTIHQTGKARNRLMKHLHHDYDVDAAIYMWEHIEDLEYIRVSTLGEGKDMTLQENIDNVQRKRDRHVEDYIIYRLKFGGRNYLVKTERLTYGNEQPYSLYEE